MISPAQTPASQIHVEPKHPAHGGRLTLTADEEQLAQTIAANIKEIIANEDRHRAQSVERDAV